MRVSQRTININLGVLLHVTLRVAKGWCNSSVCAFEHVFRNHTNPLNYSQRP